VLPVVIVSSFHGSNAVLLINLLVLYTARCNTTAYAQKTHQILPPQSHRTQLGLCFRRRNLKKLLSYQACQDRLSQATTPSTNSGHHWQCMAREHPFEGNYGASQTLWKQLGSIRSRAAPSVAYSIFPATPYLWHWGTRRRSQVRFARGLALAGIGTSVELGSFSETNYVTFPSKGW